MRAYARFYYNPKTKLDTKFARDSASLLVVLPMMTCFSNSTCAATSFCFFLESSLFSRRTFELEETRLTRLKSVGRSITQAQADRWLGAKERKEERWKAAR